MTKAVPQFSERVYSTSVFGYLPPGRSMDSRVLYHWAATIPTKLEFQVAEALASIGPLAPGVWPRDLTAKVVRERNALKEIQDVLSFEPGFLVSQRCREAFEALVPSDVEFLPVKLQRAGKPIEGYSFMHVHLGIDCIARDTARFYTREFDKRVIYHRYDIMKNRLPTRPFIGRVVDSELSVFCSPEVPRLFQAQHFTGVAFFGVENPGRKLV